MLKRAQVVLEPAILLEPLQLATLLANLPVPMLSVLLQLQAPSVLPRLETHLVPLQADLELLQVDLVLLQVLLVLSLVPLVALLLLLAVVHSMLLPARPSVPLQLPSALPALLVQHSQRLMFSDRLSHPRALLGPLSRPLQLVLVNSEALEHRLLLVQPSLLAVEPASVLLEATNQLPRLQRSLLLLALDSERKQQPRRPAISLEAHLVPARPLQPIHLEFNNSNNLHLLLLQPFPVIFSPISHSNNNSSSNNQQLDNPCFLVDSVALLQLNQLLRPCLVHPSQQLAAISVLLR